MKVAARFPIKQNRFLFMVLILAHVGVLTSGFLLVNNILVLMLVSMTTLTSVFFSLKQYRSITNSPDDLCWSGDAWMMHDSSSNSIQYMDMLNTSWITPYFCLLKFQYQEQELAWFFSRNTLGDRLYRELCYLSNACIKNS